MIFRLKRFRAAPLFALALLGAGAAGAALLDQQIKGGPLDLTAYLSAEDAAWIRPGLNITIQDVTINAARKVVTTFRFTDGGNQPLDRDGVLSPGRITSSVLIAYIPQNADQYVSYATRIQTSPITGVSAIQATTDSGGTYASLGNGLYTYTSGNTLPASYDMAATHTVGVQAYRDLREWGLPLYVSNVVKNWVPNGSPVTKIRDVVKTAMCLNCHDPLAFHGSGARREIELCVICHTPQSPDPDTGNTTDLRVMVHKIHRGSRLPSVIGGKPYMIIGNAQSVHDYSHINYPMDIRNCDSCHKGTKQEYNHFTNPGVAACGSCHDEVDFRTGQNHIGGPQRDDSLCKICHWADTGREYDASVMGAHIAPFRSSQLRNPKLEIVSITNTAPGQKPVVKFKLTDKDGTALPPAWFGGTTGRLRFTLAGPNTDYTWYLQESADRATTDSAGVSTYTFTGSLPADAAGVYTLESEGRLATTLNPGTTKQFSYNNSLNAPVVPFAVTGTARTARRTVVEMAKCNKCHGFLAFHGGSRVKVEQCVVCHNPTLTGSAGTGLPRDSVSMQYMIHKIHTGEELNGTYRIGSYNFKEVLYPGDRRNCLACHTAGTYTLPLPTTNAAVSVPAGYWTPIRPMSAACLSCHDSISAAAHAFINTATFGESCDVCHKESAEFSVSKAHAR